MAVKTLGQLVSEEGREGGGDEGREGGREPLPIRFITTDRQTGWTGTACD